MASVLLGVGQVVDVLLAGGQAWATGGMDAEGVGEAWGSWTGGGGVV